MEKKSTEIENLRTLMKLKQVERAIPLSSSLGTRNESTAEHTWSCIIIADYFLTKISRKLDRTRVIDLLLYHDLVEIEAGDTDFKDEKRLINKKEREDKAVETLVNKLTKFHSDRLKLLFLEFEELNTFESKFANAIDKLEPVIHLLDYKDTWEKRGLTEEILKSKKEEYFRDFPEIMAFWKDLLALLKSEGYVR